MFAGCAMVARTCADKHGRITAATDVKFTDYHNILGNSGFGLLRT